MVNNKTKLNNQTNNPFSIQINSSTSINNLYAYILYNYVSDNQRGIQLKPNSKNQFMNKNSNNINKSKFLNYPFKNNKEQFQNFISLFDKSSVEFAFLSDIQRIQLYINDQLFFNYQELNRANNPMRKKYIQYIQSIQNNRNTIVAHHNRKNQNNIDLSEITPFLNETFNINIIDLLNKFNYDQKYLLLLKLLCTQITMAAPTKIVDENLQNNKNKGAIIYKQKNYHFHIHIDETQISFENEMDLNFSVVNNGDPKSIGDYHFSFRCDLLQKKGTICIYSNDFLQNPYQIYIKNKNKINKHEIMISNLKQYCIYNYASVSNKNGIQMKTKYISLFYKKIHNNIVELDKFKILCSSQLNKIIETQFFEMFDETTILAQFKKDYTRGIYQINGASVNSEKINANHFLEQIISNSNLNHAHIQLFIPLVCNQVSQANIASFIWKHFDIKYNIISHTSYKIVQNKDIIYNIETQNKNNVLIDIICIYEVHKVLSNNITAPREIIQISQKFDLSENKLTISIEDLPLVNNKYQNLNNSSISSKFQKNISSLQYAPLKTNMIPIKKNPSQIIQKNPDFYLITFNEGAESYQYTLQKYTSYLKELQPKIIAVCTQESKSGGQEHFQHIMKKYLTKNSYSLIQKYNASSRSGDVIPGKTNKNVRTRIYYHQDFVSKNIDNGMTNNENSNENSNTNFNTNSNRSSSVNSYNSNNIQSGGLNQTNKIDIVSLYFKQSERSGLGSISQKTLYKGSIYAKLILNINHNVTNLVIVNSHLYYQKNGNTGLKKRQTEFIDLINEFQLIDEWKQGAHIFFVGDLNFRLFSLDPTFVSMPNLQKPQIPLSNLWKKKRNSDFKNQMENFIQQYQQISNEIIENYASNQSYYKYQFLDKRKKNDELYQFINTYIEYLVKTNKNQYQNTIDFFENFLESIQLLGLHLTSKYHPKLFTQNQKFYSTYDQIFEYNNKVFDQPSQSYLSIPKNKLHTSMNSSMSNKKNISSIQKKQIADAIEKGRMPEESTIFNILPKDGYFRIPSMTDRILYSLHPQKGEYVPDIKPDNFNVFLTPDESDHKLISLAFNFKLYDKNKVSSNKKVHFNNNQGRIIGERKK